MEINIKIDIKNCTCFYFDDMIKIEHFDFNTILVDEKLYENMLLHNISYKTLIGAKPLRIKFDKINGLELMMKLDI